MDTDFSVNVILKSIQAGTNDKHCHFLTAVASINLVLFLLSVGSVML